MALAKMIAMLVMIAYSPIVYGQCAFTLSGKVTDISGSRVQGVLIGIDSLDKAALSTAGGEYHIEGLCPGSYKVTCTAVGFRSQIRTVTLPKNARMDWVLLPDTTLLNEVLIKGHQQEGLSTLAQSSLSAESLFKSRSESLGESLKQIPGLNSVQMGPTLSKPVIHGLHSHRILILNNGVRQEGQQWGNDHAPEIDPFTADKVSVIKGAASIMYGSDAISGVVLLEPDSLPTVPGLHGNASVVAASNGRMGAASAMGEGAFGHRLQGFSWRLQGTLKRAGNFSTPHYYMSNTGLKETDFSAAAGYVRGDLKMNVYYSQYNSKIGIFDGSHVGNLDDLEAAFKRPRPITPSYFSYKINRSYQSVHHRLWKATAGYSFSNNGSLELKYARQWDLRDEYDIDIPYSQDPAVLNMPQVSFKLVTHTLDVVYREPGSARFSGSIGLSGSTQGNVFKGLRYLIPNFRNYGGGIYAIEHYHKDHWDLEGGLRYDYLWLRVYQRNQTTLGLYHSTFDYSNASGTVGAGYRFSSRFSAKVNVGTGWRAPSINELYIHGVHFSAATYELGDSTLSSEHSFNTTLNVHYASGSFQADLDVYDNEIDHFIYAKPTLEPVTIISGTYPAFQYTQDNVRLSGFDLEASYGFLKHFDITSKTGMVRGFNKSIHDYLIQMPSDRFDNTLAYRLDSLGRFRNCSISLQNISVRKQNRVPPNSDYVPPPDGYSLLNADISFQLPLQKKKRLDIDFAAKNLTNKAYRDYLNLFRYYTDDLGLNLVLSGKFTF